jgi:hypothetical protein
MRGRFNLRPLDAIICSDWKEDNIISEIVHKLIDEGYSIYYDAEQVVAGLDLVRELYKIIQKAPVIIYFYPYYTAFSQTLSEYSNIKRKLLVVLPKSDFEHSSVKGAFAATDVINIDNAGFSNIDQIVFQIGMKLIQVIGKPKRPRIFLSYAHEDFEKVQELYLKLQSAGFEPWYDKKNLDIGDIWENEISKSLKETDFFIFCMSIISVKKKGYIDKEITMAATEFEERGFDKGIILPIRLDNCEIPNTKMGEYYTLDQFQWLDLRENGAYDKLENGIWKHWKRLSRY